jgi:hypothetical protein
VLVNRGLIHRENEVVPHWDGWLQWMQSVSWRRFAWYRKVSDHRIRTVNDRALRSWIADPGFAPVFQDCHKHEAKWNWW